MTSFHSNLTSPNSSLPANQPPLIHRPFSDPNRLAPEDAFFAQSPPRRQREIEAYTPSLHQKPTAGHIDSRSGGYRPRHDKEHGRSRSRRRKGVWKKLLWVKQSYPDNYTDPPTFLSHLQRNPRLLPYDFWPLVADSTVIVQHICSVAIFVWCFVGIIQERVSPVSVVSWGSAGTVLGWLLWDFWLGQAQTSKVPTEVSSSSSTSRARETNLVDGLSSTTTTSSYSANHPPLSSQQRESLGPGLGLTLATANLSSRKDPSHSQSPTSIPSAASSAASPIQAYPPSTTPNFAKHGVSAPYHSPNSNLSPRNQQRLATAKSAILIYCALLALSPILKSLTKSTTSDSIWAMSCWLMCINILFFDYGGGVGVKFPASLSTNAALMASTVLASRLPSTTHVFSLTLFSIEVFGLFPVFRRHLRHISWRGHLLLTIVLVIGAGAGMGIALGNRHGQQYGPGPGVQDLHFSGIGGSSSSSSTGILKMRSKGEGGGVGGGDEIMGAGWQSDADFANTWRAACLGVGLWGIGTAIGMGMCSWWLIGLQKYKDVVIGPWDPARPIIRQVGGWE